MTMAPFKNIFEIFLVVNESEEMFRDMTSNLQLPEGSPVASAEPPQVQDSVQDISQEKEEVTPKETEVSASDSAIPPAPEIMISETKETSFEATKTKDQSAIEEKAKEKGKLCRNVHINKKF